MMNTRKNIITICILSYLAMRDCYGLTTGQRKGLGHGLSRKIIQVKKLGSVSGKGRRPPLELDFQDCGGIDYFSDDKVLESKEGGQETNKIKIGLRNKITFYVNPCTGSISLHTHIDLDAEPCSNETNLPTSIPSSRSFQEPSFAPNHLYKKVAKETELPVSSTFSSLSPSSPPSSPPSIALVSHITSPVSLSVSESSKPSTFPSSSSESPSLRPSLDGRLAQDEIIESISCPQKTFDTCLDFNNNTFLVDFKYSLETTDAIALPDTVLPKLEETLLQKLAKKLLSHCFNTTTAEISSKTDSKRQLLTRKYLKGSNSRRHNVIVGICSKPKDVQKNEEYCAPEINDDNNCFVVDGSVTVAVDENALLKEINVINHIRNVTQELMYEDELLTQDNPGLKRVRYLEDDVEGSPKKDDEIGEVERTDPNAKGQPAIPLVISASVLAFGSLLGLYLVKRYFAALTKTEKPLSEQPAKILSPCLSFVSPDSGNLANYSSCVDVHQCKSLACQKCYDGQQTHFEQVQSYPFPRFDIGQFQESKMDENTVEQVKSISL